MRPQTPGSWDNSGASNGPGTICDMIDQGLMGHSASKKYWCIKKNVKKNANKKNKDIFDLMSTLMNVASQCINGEHDDGTQNEQLKSVRSYTRFHKA
jgi:hypothetical protein